MGNGVHIKLLTDLYKNLNLIGVDISLQALINANKFIKEKKWTAVHADVAELPFNDQTFDIIFSFGFFIFNKKTRRKF